MTDRWFLGIGANLVNQGSELLQNIFDRLDQAGTVADQAMAAPAGHAIGRPGYGEDLAILFHGVLRGRERLAARGRLTTTTPRNSPEMIRLRWENQSASLRQAV